MKRLLLVILMVLVTLVGVVGVSSAADTAIQTVITQLQTIQNEVQALQATSNAGVQVKPKEYYLTSGQFSGDQAIAACSTGFHMASIFEILDTSNLQYVKRSTTVCDSLVDDQGDGLPTKEFGWVRTGYDSTSYMDVVSPELSSVNCNSWTSQSSNAWGTVARLYDNDTAVQLNSEYTLVNSRQCNQSYPVWCVENSDLHRTDLSARR